uniref:Uncharacterized protein n=1 Tax=Lygus hesperus TaxID=30085 RepID=A0A146LGZ5_LYGHE
MAARKMFTFFQQVKRQNITALYGRPPGEVDEGDAKIHTTLTHKSNENDAHTCGLDEQNKTVSKLDNHVNDHSNNTHTVVTTEMSKTVKARSSGNNDKMIYDAPQAQDGRKKQK